MHKYDVITQCIENNPYIWTDYINNQLRETRSLELINEIIDKTKKQLGEAVMLLICILRYLMNNTDALVYLEKHDLFNNYIKDNYDKIIELAIKKNVQGNIAERGLPIFEILGLKYEGKSVSLIELGSSYGLIGYCLLNKELVLKNRNKYFCFDQQMPQNPHGIDKYLGIEIDIPEKEWIFACLENSDQKYRLENFINDTKKNERLHIEEASAFGFSKLKIVEDFISDSERIVVLTSFLFYQFNSEKQDMLKKEIFEFIGNNNFNWINQVVEINSISEKDKYYIEWNNERIIKLKDDMCNSWEWIK